MTYNFWDTLKVRAWAPPLNFYLWATARPPPYRYTQSIYLNPYLCTYIVSEHLFGKIYHIDRIISSKWTKYQIIYSLNYFKNKYIIFKHLILKVICYRRYFFYFSIPYMYVYQLMCIAARTVHIYSLVHNISECSRLSEKKSQNEYWNANVSRF